MDCFMEDLRTDHVIGSTRKIRLNYLKERKKKGESSKLLNKEEFCFLSRSARAAEVGLYTCVVALHTRFVDKSRAVSVRRSPLYTRSSTFTNTTYSQ